MKKTIFSKIFVALAVVTASLTLGSCSNEDNFWSTAVSISGTGVANHQATIVKGSTLQLTAHLGLLAGGTGYEWTSTNPEVATVDQNGLVKAVEVGETTIIAETTGCEVTYLGEITIYVVNQSLGLVDDQIDQSEAE